MSSNVGVLRLSRWLLRYAMRRRWGAAGVLATMLLATGLNVLMPWPMKILVDYVLGGETMPDRVAGYAALLPGGLDQGNLLFWCVAATIVLFLLSWALTLATALVNVGFAQRVSFDLASDLFSHLQRLSLGFHAWKPVGDSTRRVVSDSDCVGIIVKDGLLPVLTSAVGLSFMFAVMWNLDPALTLVSLVVVPFMFLVFRAYANSMQERSYAQHEIEGRQYDVIEETFSAISVVQAFGREPAADRRFRESSSAIVDATLASTAVGLQFKILMGLATAGGTALILWIGTQRVLDGGLTVGSILVFLSYLGSLYLPLEALMYSPATIQTAAGSARRVMEVLEAEPEVASRPGAPALGPVRGHVRLEGVTFGYEAGQPVLKEITLEAKPGETVALVGMTGAGKSTLVSLIPRFHDPWSGRVLIDGQDLRDVDLRSVRSQVGIVLQEAFLFPIPVAENIAYGRPEATREQIVAAAKAANAHGFIEQLPEGYETRLGERGATLSGGQRQRLSIARALLKDAPILILDEPTSALDAETEGLLLEALGRLMAGRTTFIIAHRLSTIRNADRIVVLEDGAIAEIGSHQQLLERNGRYRRLNDLQFVGEPAALV